MAQDTTIDTGGGYGGGYDDPYGPQTPPGYGEDTDSGFDIQDPTTGRWVPYTPESDNGRGNIRVDGVVYAHDGGIFAHQLGDLWMQHYNRKPSQQEIAEMYKAPGGIPWITAQFQAPPPTTEQPPAPPSTGDGAGGGGGNNPPPTLTPPGPPTGPPAWMGDAPTFTPPPFTKPDAFHAPTPGEVEADPGYLFSRQQGEQALGQSQAAQGLANTGGSIKDFIAYGQNLANTRYNDVTARNKDIYNTNYQTQYVDPYKMQYQGAMDAFVPKMQEWQTKVATTADQRNFDWKQYLDKWNQYFTTVTAQ